MPDTIDTFSWIGSDSPHIGKPSITTAGKVVIGRYGGHEDAGAAQNTHGALVWAAPDGAWEFAALMAATTSAQSAALVLDVLQNAHTDLTHLLDEPASYAFPQLKILMESLFNSADFRAQAQQLYGESSVLLVARKGGFLWWMNIGDSVVYVLHPELAQRHHYALNQRHAFQWVGRSNTFALPVPAYSNGVCELRQKRSTLVMTSGSLLDTGSVTFADPSLFYAWFMERDDLSESVQMALLEVYKSVSAASVTLIAWRTDNPNPASQPSR